MGCYYCLKNVNIVEKSLLSAAQEGMFVLFEDICATSCIREVVSTGSVIRYRGNGRIDGQGSQVDGQGSEVNDGVDRVPDFSTIITQQLHNLLPTIEPKGDVVNNNIRGDVRNVIENNDRRGCTYKVFLACNLKEYDGKRGTIVYTCWIEKMESVQDMSGYRDSQKVKYPARSFVDFKTLTREEFFLSNEIQKLKTELLNHAMVGAGHATYTDRFHELARLVPHLVTLENKRIEMYIYGLTLQIRGMVAATEPMTIRKAMQIVGPLIDEAIRNGLIKKNPEKRGNMGEPSKDRNGRDDNKRTRTGNAFATTTNPIRRENTGTAPKCTTYNFHHPPKTPCRTCFNCNHPGHFAKNSRVVPRNVKPINAKNPTVRTCYECGSTDHFKAASPREFMLGAEEARQDPNIVMDTFTLNNHYATTLFDSGVDYGFVFTTFIPLLGIEPNDLGFSYEIEITSGQLVEINKVIKGCKLEIEGHEFDINLIPFGSESFNVIIGMDWLSNHKAEKICHEKKQEEMLVVRDFPEVFPDDLSRLPPSQKIKFWNELVPGAILVVESPYLLVPSEIKELSDPSKIEAVKNWEAPRTPSKVRSFLGLARYYRWFIENFAKEKLCNAPVLALPDGPEDFMVYYDASGLGLGCVLMRRGKVIAYASRQLKIHKKNYTTHDLELGAVVFALKIWRYYLYRTKSIIYTDHKSLQPIFSQKELNMRQHHGIEFFSDYDCEIRYYPDKANVVADVLKDHKMDRLARLYLNEIVARHGVPISIISDHDSRFIETDSQSERTIQTLEDMLRECVLDFEGSWDVHLSLVDFSYNNSYHSSVRCASFEALYGRKCRSIIMWPEVGEGQLIGPELVQETTKKILQIKDRLKATRNCQKRYADKRRKPLEFSVDEYVLLKVSPWKGVVRFGRKGKLALRYVGPFEITEWIGLVAYRHRLLEELNVVHDTFHVSNLKKCLADPTLQVPLDEI
nr:retrovirus-related Pol polyprotein from transposon 17.6 [Tanacetum cinerariifolium]